VTKKTVFISSTFKDLHEHRRAVWEALKRFDVSIRGMEAFGARTTGPLDTCLAEVDESDVYVGIIAYRLGSIEAANRKPFTELEYERAVEGKKEILIYLADDETASFPFAVVDQDTASRKRLEAFKKKLRERHTIGTFSTADDLAEKLTRDFAKHFLEKQPDRAGDDEAYTKTLTTLRNFRLTPKRYNGREVRLQVEFYWSVFPASRELCRQFNLEYGYTVGSYFRMVRPNDKEITAGFKEMYAAGRDVDAFVAALTAKPVDLFAQLRFSEEDVKNERAEFLGHSFYDDGSPDGDPNEIYVAPEGKVILLFTKRA
jgi:hypothetical protein